MNFTAHQVSTAKVFCETFLLSKTSEKIVKKMPVNYHYAETVDMIYELVNLRVCKSSLWYPGYYRVK